MRGRVPARAGAGAAPRSCSFINGPEAFTPDGEFILGETRGAGLLRRRGLLRARHRRRRRHRQGHGRVDRRRRARVRPVEDGHPPLRPHYRSQRYALARTTEVYSQYYDIHYPGEERQAGRPLHVSRRVPAAASSSAPSSARSPAGSARTGSSRTRPRGDESLRPRGWAGEHWSPAIERRAPRDRATRPRSSTSRASRRSRCTGRARSRSSSGSARTTSTGPSGSVVYTQMLNRRGGIECDLTVDAPRGRPLPARDRHGVRRARPRLAAAPPARRRLGLRRRRDGARARCFGLWGPRARDDPAVADDDRPLATRRSPT